MLKGIFHNGNQKWNVSVAKFITHTMGDRGFKIRQLNLAETWYRFLEYQSENGWGGKVHGGSVFGNHLIHMCFTHTQSAQILCCGECLGDTGNELCWKGHCTMKIKCKMTLKNYRPWYLGGRDLPQVIDSTMWVTDYTKRDIARCILVCSMSLCTVHHPYTMCRWKCVQSTTKLMNGTWWIAMWTPRRVPLPRSTFPVAVLVGWSFNAHNSVRSRDAFTTKQNKRFTTCKSMLKHACPCS